MRGWVRSENGGRLLRGARGGFGLLLLRNVPVAAEAEGERDCGSGSGNGSKKIGDRLLDLPVRRALVCEEG